jgi:hypothetical protein
MKYPKHVILDLQTPNLPDINHPWDHEFIRKTALNPSTKVSTFLKSRNVTGAAGLFTPRRTSIYSKSLTSPLFDINFLRKEKIYTKLKYSRCPQYDIVSGGFAALLAGFLGFLISEKFGIELVDSGDFYIAFMYIVIASFSIRPLIRIYSKDSAEYTPLSPKYVLIFFRDLLVLLLNEFKALAAYLRSVLKI